MSSALLIARKSWLREASIQLWMKAERHAQTDIEQSVLAFLKEQRTDVARELRRIGNERPGLTTKPNGAARIIDEAFDPEEWDKRLRTAVGAAVARTIIRGYLAAEAVQRARRRRFPPVWQKNSKQGWADVPLTDEEEQAILSFELPPNVTRRVFAHTGEIMSKPYWKDVNETERTRMQWSIQEGIEEGRTLKQIADDIRKDIDADEVRARRIATTEATGALSAGHIMEAEQGEEAGLAILKTWISIGDDKVRDSHVEADGQVVEGSAGLFEVGGYKTPYPGWADLPAEERIGCRCYPLIEPILGTETAAQHVEAYKAARLKYDPDQPRVPAGSPEGGQFGEGGGAGEAASELSDIGETFHGPVEDYGDALRGAINEESPERSGPAAYAALDAFKEDFAGRVDDWYDSVLEAGDSQLGGRGDVDKLHGATRGLIQEFQDAAEEVVDLAADYANGLIEEPDPSEPTDKLEELHSGLQDRLYGMARDYLGSIAQNEGEKGGPGSGHFGHGGRPGEIGGSVSSGGETLDAASRDAEGIWRIGEKPAPEHVQRMGIPPAWREVYVNQDPKGSMMARGLDSKGRLQVRYSASHNARTAADKFGRVSELREKKGEILREIDRDAKTGDEEIKENAECLRVVMTTGIRPGSDRDTKAEKQAYGATTLEGRHIKVEGDEVRLSFTGKKGVALDLPVVDPRTATILRGRAATAGNRGRLFDTNAEKLRDYSKEKGGGGFKTKDHRTALGTETAIAAIKSGKEPGTMKEYKRAVKGVATKVSQVLGNTPSVALKAYIDPQVFAGWRAKIGA